MPNLATRRPGVPATPVRTLAVQLLAFSLAFPGALPGNASSAVEANAPSSEIQFQRHYKATAYITLLSITIFSRAGVGFGFASIDERTQGARQPISLRFLSGSTPERARGLNRFGFIQENVEQENSATVAANYFALMTANGEESLSEAKAELDSTSDGQVAFVAARAAISRQKTCYSVRHLLLPSSYRGSNADQLLEQVQAEFAAPPAGQAEKTETLDGAPTGTFLNSLRQAILTAGDSYQSRIVFNGKTFQFKAAKRPDGKTGAELRRAGLTASPEAIVQLSGILRNEKTNEVTTFRLWFEQGLANFLPLRFEFKAKSYLRLVFDEEPPPPAQTLTLNREPAQ
jgi:hypothetical protein